MNYEERNRISSQVWRYWIKTNFSRKERVIHLRFFKRFKIGSIIFIVYVVHSSFADIRCIL